MMAFKSMLRYAIPSIRCDAAQSSPCSNVLINYLQNRGAARKGKRIQRAREARARALLRRINESKEPKNKKSIRRNVKVDKSQFRFLDHRQLDLTLPPPPEDDVYFIEPFRRKRYNFDEAVNFFRQICHPDIMNQPDALLSATIELNLKMKIKRKKYIETILSTVCYPHEYNYQVRPRKIVALCKDPADQQAAKDAGAIQVGSNDIASLLKTNQLTQRDFDHLVCHTEYLPEFAAVKGMRGHPFFPNKMRGNFGSDMASLVKYFKDGVDYSLRKEPDDPSFGFIDCHFGKVNMTNEQLRDNIIALFSHVNRFKPLNLADDKQFYERVTITSPATDEIVFIKFWELIQDYVDPDDLSRDSTEVDRQVEASQ